MITEAEIVSEWLPGSRKAFIHSAARGSARDCLVFLDGELYADRVKAPEIVQRAQLDGTLPPIASVYLPNASAESRHQDYVCDDRFASFVRDLPRWIERHTASFDRYYLCGLSLSGLQALFTALTRPDVFAGVLSQSPSAWWNDEKLLRSLLRNEGSRCRFRLSVGTSELQENVSHPPTGLFQRSSQRDSVRRLATAMSDAGYELRLVEYDGGHDPARWADELPDALNWLLD